MSYIPQNWQDEILVGEEKYVIKDGAGAVLLDDVKIEMKTEAIQAGSDVTAERMNHLEQGVAQAGGAASETSPGTVELATATETSEGSDNTRAVTPDGLAGSDYGKRVAIIPVIGNSEDLTTGDGKRIISIPQEINGWKLVAAHAVVYTVSSSGTPTVQVRNLTDGVDVLSTRITIDVAQYNSYAAVTQPVIDATYNDVATGDRIAIDVDAAGTGTKGLDVILTFQRINP
jgi:hypothetical protein